MFDKDDRVMTTKGAGIVAYRRMRAPEYSEVEAYSIALDDKVEATKHPPFPSYTGTILPAEDVWVYEGKL
jgi:hypothetical protein